MDDSVDTCIKSGNASEEYFFAEGCFITEWSNSADDPYVSIVQDIPETRGREWTSVRDHTSVISISPECPIGHKPVLFLKSESASFHWTPDARYGEKLLYQAIQLHRVHVNRLELMVGKR